MRPTPTVTASLTFWLKVGGVLMLARTSSSEGNMFIKFLSSSFKGVGGSLFSSCCGNYYSFTTISRILLD